MATTYGYGGEFSSDEDIEKVEQQSERLNQSKFDSYAQLKPTGHQIEEAIETIRKMPLDQDVAITDELLAGLLDHYKTQRGPIVDSTRNLYKKIILRLIRGDQQQAASNGDSVKDSNGNNNNNVPVRRETVEVASSDEDEPMPPASNLDMNKGKRFDSRVVYNNNNDRLEPMEVDSEASALGSIRANKQVDMSSSEDDDSETEESSDSDSEVLDVTPVKPTEQVVQQKQPQKVTSATDVPVDSKAQEVVKKATVQAGKESSDQKKKPYTRSQRVTTRATSARKITQLDVSSSKGDPVASSVDSSVFKTTSNDKFKLIGKSGLKFIISAFIAGLLGLAAFYIRADLLSSSDKFLFKSGIKF